jgi:hypothetical protein
MPHFQGNTSHTTISEGAMGALKDRSNEAHEAKIVSTFRA